MRNYGLIAALMMAGIDLQPFRLFTREQRSTGNIRKFSRRPRSKYMPHSGAKEQAKHLARLARGIVECPHHQEAPLAMAA